MQPLTSRKRSLVLGLALGGLLYLTSLAILDAGQVIWPPDLVADLDDLGSANVEKEMKTRNETAHNKSLKSDDGGRRREKDDRRARRKTRERLSSLMPSNASALRDIHYDQYSSADRSILESRVGILTDRALAVSRECGENPSLAEKPLKKALVWDLNHSPSVVWCPVYKVASTTWMRNFLRLAHFNEDNPLIPRNISDERRDHLRFKVNFGATHEQVFKLYPGPESAAERDRVLKESVRVIIVRHPFTRILSAYRDKMAKAKPRPAKFGFRELQASIVAKYRSHRSQDDSPIPSFPEFVQYVIDSTAKLSSARDWNENVKCWLPYWVQCSVCALDYNIIMKLETMREDELFLITLSRLEELKGRTNWVHLNGNSSSDVASQYYKQLTRRQMLKLHKRYEADFKLFQYDIDDYLSIAKDAED